LIKAANSGELLRAAQDSGSRTNDADILLTSKRVSWVASCRRGGGGGELGLGLPAALESKRRRLGWLR
jgi:hypothetical protein